MPINNDDLQPSALLKRVRRIASRLRQQQMQYQQGAKEKLPAFSSADIYFEPGPGGEYPIVTLRSQPCIHFLRGECVPCAYSARPRPQEKQGLNGYPNLLVQMDNLFARFDEIFTQRAQGSLPGYRFRVRQHEQIYMLQLAGESSFFSDREIPPEYRQKILHQFAQFSTWREVDWHLMLETRPEDLLKAAHSGELDRLRPLLAKLNVVVNMGLEHRDDFLRQVVFAKRLSMADFLQAVDIAKDYGLDPGVFLFAGGFILTPKEAIEQVVYDLELLSRLGVFVNLMLPNLQAFTIPDVLYDAGVYSLPEPHWLLDLADIMQNYSPQRDNAITPTHWFLGGFVAEPMPVGNIIAHPQRQSSDVMAQNILMTVRDLILTGNRMTYKKRRFLLANRHEVCYRESREDVTTWPKRTYQSLSVCEDHMECYLQTRILR